MRERELALEVGQGIFVENCIGGLWRMGGRSKCLVKVVNEINKKSQLVRDTL